MPEHCDHPRDRSLLAGYRGHLAHQRLRLLARLLLRPQWLPSVTSVPSQRDQEFGVGNHAERDRLRSAQIRQDHAWLPRHLPDLQLRAARGIRGESRDATGRHGRRHRHDHRPGPTAGEPDPDPVLLPGLHSDRDQPVVVVVARVRVLCLVAAGLRWRVRLAQASQREPAAAREPGTRIPHHARVDRPRLRSASACAFSHHRLHAPVLGSDLGCGVHPEFPDERGQLRARNACGDPVRRHRAWRASRAANPCRADFGEALLYSAAQWIGTATA